MTTVLESLNKGLHRAFAVDPTVFLLGEDILDPYGGAFKVTRGLSDTYPERVFTTPISEAGIVGLAGGMAMRGLKPVVEIMFGDFITLIADQLINHLTKFRWMYNELVKVPIVIRTPMGGRRGYGPTHSQTLEKLFLGTPGLRVIAPSTISSGRNTYPGDILFNAIIKNDDPVLFIENKLQYLLDVNSEKDLHEFNVVVNSSNSNYDDYNNRLEINNIPLPAFSLTLLHAPPPSITLATYGYMAELARKSALQLAYEQEIFIEIVVMTQLTPFDITPILESTRQTGQLLVVEEGTLTLGWGAEVIARVAEKLGPALKKSRRIAALDLPIPAAGLLESIVLPDTDEIKQAVIEMVRNQD